MLVILSDWKHEKFSMIFTVEQCKKEKGVFLYSVCKILIWTVCYTCFVFVSPL